MPGEACGNWNRAGETTGRAPMGRGPGPATPDDPTGAARPGGPPRNGDSPPPINWTPGNEAVAPTPEWEEDPMEVTASGMESSGIAPPVAA